MPVYSYVAPPHALDLTTRAAVARAITDAHHRVTATPEVLIHVIFIENAGASVHCLRAPLRAGRPHALEAELLKAVSTSAAAAAGTEVAELEVEVTHLPAHCVMEGGLVLPEPGDESEWLEANRSFAWVGRVATALEKGMPGGLR